MIYMIITYHLLSYTYLQGPYHKEFQDIKQRLFFESKMLHILILQSRCQVQFGIWAADLKRPVI